MISCCEHKNEKSCLRTLDKKMFKLPRKFSKKDCLTKKIKGFSMKSSCAPYKNCKNYTMKNKNPVLNAICILNQNDNNVKGTIHFKNINNKLYIKYNISGLSDGEHGFHVHEYGDLSDNCNSGCSHFNPFNETHGGPNSNHRHAGDLGNIISKNNVAKGTIVDNILSLDFNKNTCIIGRMMIVHEQKDDLGLGNNDESLKTGNAGKRLACGIIGITK
jgi:superoxide dismutase, Cu-Zn family